MENLKIHVENYEYHLENQKV